MKLFLHIGTQKTGSTAIQAMLHANRVILGRAGVHVLCESRTANLRRLAAACVNIDKHDDYFLRNDINTEATRSAFRREVFAEFAAEMAGLPDHIHTVVISGEHFSSNTALPEEIARLHSLVTPYFSGFRVLCYLRDQVSLRSAGYTTALKSGQTIAFGNSVARCDPRLPFFNYQLMLDNWAAIFGKPALDVRLFDAKHWHNGNLIDDVLFTLAPDLLTKISRDPRPRNPSLNHHGQLLLRVVNEVLPTKHGQPSNVRYQLVQMCEAHFSGKGQYPPASEQAEIYAAFRASNAAVARDYLGMKGDLFPPPAYDEGLMPLEPDFISAIATLLSAFVEPDMIVLPGIYADLFRDAATKLEADSPETAYKLMHLASVMRPSGQVIQRKLKEMEAKFATLKAP